MQENDGEAAVRAVARMMRGSVIDTHVAQRTHLDETGARVDIAGVLDRIRTPQWATKYRELEASTLALQTQAEEHARGRVPPD